MRRKSLWGTTTPPAHSLWRSSPLATVACKWGRVAAYPRVTSPCYTDGMGNERDTADRAPGPLVAQGA